MIRFLNCSRFRHYTACVHFKNFNHYTCLPTGTNFSNFDQPRKVFSFSKKSDRDDLPDDLNDDVRQIRPTSIFSFKELATLFLLPLFVVSATMLVVWQVVKLGLGVSSVSLFVNIQERLSRRWSNVCTILNGWSKEDNYLNMSTRI